MLITEGTGEGIAREAAEKKCCGKVKNTLLVVWLWPQLRGRAKSDGLIQEKAALMPGGPVKKQDLIKRLGAKGNRPRAEITKKKRD